MTKFKVTIQKELSQVGEVLVLLNGDKSCNIQGLRSSVYYDNIIACVLFYYIVMGTSHSTVPDSLALYMQLSGELIGSVDTIIYVVALQCHS